MITLIQVFVLLAIVWYAAYVRARTGMALAAAFVALLLFSFGGYFKFIPWLLIGIFAVLYFANDLRKDQVTRSAFKLFKKVLPPMNQTEQEALEAGDVWWDGELFRGKPDWSQLSS